MLTDSEKRWLGRRKLYAGVNRWSRFSCQWCEHLDVDREGYRTPCGASIYGCQRVDMDGDNDDVEFEAQVAAKLAELFANISLVGNATEFDCESSCPAFSMCCTILRDDLPCDDAILMYARLKVEEEMDEQNPFD